MRPIGPLLVLLALSATAGTAGAWELVLPDTAMVDGGAVTLGAIAVGSIPKPAADLVIHPGGRPNTSARITRQGILRRLVEAGLSRDVRLSGPRSTRLVFEGESVLATQLEDAIRRAVQPLVKGGPDGAPATWFEMNVPKTGVAVAGDWKIVVPHDTRLEAGRNLVNCRLVAGGVIEPIPVVVDLHIYDEVPTARTDLRRGHFPRPNDFAWEWRDLAGLDDATATGRDALKGVSLTRDVAAGQILRRSDLMDTPVVAAGDAVELLVRRGQVTVTVRAFARGSGGLGQTIAVRNEITGRMVNARVAGPGLVEWSR